MVRIRGVPGVGCFVVRSRLLDLNKAFCPEEEEEDEEEVVQVQVAAPRPPREGGIGAGVSELSKVIVFTGEELVKQQGGGGSSSSCVVPRGGGEAGEGKLPVGADDDDDDDPKQKGNTTAVTKHQQQQLISVPVGDMRMQQEGVQVHPHQLPQVIIITGAELVKQQGGGGSSSSCVVARGSGEAGGGKPPVGAAAADDDDDPKRKGITTAVNKQQKQQFTLVPVNDMGKQQEGWQVDPHQVRKVYLFTGEELGKQQGDGGSSSSCVVARHGGEAGRGKLPIGAADDDPKLQGITRALNKQQQHEQQQQFILVPVGDMRMQQEGVQGDPHQAPKVVIITGQELVQQQAGGRPPSSSCVVARGGGEAGGGKLLVGPAADDDPKHQGITRMVNEQQQKRQQFILVPVGDLRNQQEGVQADPHQFPKVNPFTGENLVRAQGGGGPSSSCVVARGGCEEAGGGKVPVGAADDDDNDPKQKGIRTPLSKQQQQQQQQQQQLTLLQIGDMTKQQEGVQADDPHRVQKVNPFTGEWSCVVARGGGEAGGGKLPVGAADDAPKVKRITTAVNKQQQQQQQQLIIMPVGDMRKQQEGVQTNPHQVPKLIGGLQQRRLKCIARSGGLGGRKNPLGGAPDSKQLKARRVGDRKKKEKMMVVVLDEDLEMVVTPAEYANWQEKQNKRKRQQEEKEKEQQEQEQEKKRKKVAEMVAMRFPPWYYKLAIECGHERHNADCPLCVLQFLHTKTATWPMEDSAAAGAAIGVGPQDRASMEKLVCTFRGKQELLTERARAVVQSKMASNEGDENTLVYEYLLALAAILMRLAKAVNLPDEPTHYTKNLMLHLLSCSNSFNDLKANQEIGVVTLSVCWVVAAKYKYKLNLLRSMHIANVVLSMKFKIKDMRSAIETCANAMKILCNLENMSTTAWSNLLLLKRLGSH